MEQEKDLIDLANAHATQLTGSDSKKTAWSIEANITNEVLGKLDGTFTEKQVFEILDFARKYELIAMNIGIQFQKKISDKHWMKIESGLTRVIEELTAENDRLSGILDTIIGEEK